MLYRIFACLFSVRMFISVRVCLCVRKSVYVLFLWGGMCTRVLCSVFVCVVVFACVRLCFRVLVRVLVRIMF